MAIVGNLNVLHESEAQRQHVRVRLPAEIEFISGGQSRRHRLSELSAAGFSFEAGDHLYTVGERHQGRILVLIDDVGFSIPVKFDTRKLGDNTFRIACQFHDLGATEATALRRIITAFVGGELTTAGDMLATLSRDNFVDARRARREPGLGFTGKLRALLGTTVVLIIGLLAAGYAVERLYQLVFVTVATAAKVAAPVYTIAMPRDATWFALVKTGDSVRKGQPLGSFQTALLDVVEGVPGSFSMTPEQLGEIVGQQLKGSIASPCDCLVQKSLATDAQYILRNQSVLKLVPREAAPYVLARFHYEQLGKLAVGRRVYVRINGATKRIAGTVTELRVLPSQTIDSDGLNDLNGLNTNAAITDVIAVIVPLKPIATSHIDQPVEVLIDPLFDAYR